MSNHVRLSQAKTREEFDALVRAKRIARMDRIDKLSPDLRALVHEYGFSIVDNFMRLGVTKPKHIKHLVEIVLNEFSPTRGANSNQGVKVAPGVQDWKE